LRDWLLAAALCGGLTAPVPAAAPVRTKAAPVRVEVRDRLHAIQFGEIGTARGVYPMYRYRIEADGRLLVLHGIERFAADAAKRDGRLVIVAGVLDGDVIHVTGFTVPSDDALIRYMRITATGRLSWQEGERPRLEPPVRGQWHLTTDAGDFLVTFADARLEERATVLLLRRPDVVLTGDLVGGQIVVRGIDAATR